MGESKECENHLANAWFDGLYDQEQAQRSAELQGIDFNNVIHAYGKLYHEQESAGAMKWN